MASVKLGAKEVGSIVRLNVGGVATEFIVVHQGLPGSMYDESCNGTWLLMKDIYENRKWHRSEVNTLESSDIQSYLDGTFLNLFDADIKAQIKQVKIPYRKNGGREGTTQNGANGLSCKIFLLSGLEVNFVHAYFDTGEGAALDYFKECATSGNDTKRVAYLNGSATNWWLRSPYITRNSNVWYVNTDGSYYSDAATRSYGLRPALVLPSTLLVSDSGAVQTNAPPTISSTSGSSGVNLGSKSAAFSFQYTPTDTDGDTLTVTEKLDGAVKKTRTNVTSGTKLTFECLNTAAEFQKITNGSHTLTVEVSDGKETTEFSASFTKAVHEASITLKTPLAAAGDIGVAVLAVAGSIPDDAEYKVEATNNANDASPVWQDVTAAVKNGVNIVFKNRTAANGAAFNFRITVKRGVSGTGGYISAVTGAFQ